MKCTAGSADRDRSRDDWGKYPHGSRVPTLVRFNLNPGWASCDLNYEPIDQGYGRQIIESQFWMESK